MSDKIRFLSQKEIMGLAFPSYYGVSVLPHLDSVTQWVHFSVRDFLQTFAACAADLAEIACLDWANGFSKSGVLTEDMIVVFDIEAFVLFFLPDFDPAYWLELNYEWLELR